MSPFLVPLLGRTARVGQAGISFTPVEGRHSAESIEASHPGSVVLGLKGDSAPSHACLNPTGGGTPLASLQVGIKCALAGEILFKAHMLIN